MGDQRVHPYGYGAVQGAPILYPSPLEAQQHYANQHAEHHNTQMPADEAILMHKEQQQRLLDQRPPTQIAANQDTTVNEQEQEQNGHRRKQRRRRRCILRCCCCVGATLGTVVVLVGILVLLFFLLLHPKLPKYTITQAEMKKFSMSNITTGAQSAVAGTLLLNAEVNFLVRLENPNKKIGIDYRSVRAALFYEGLNIGEGSIPRFYQGHRNTTYMELPLVGHNITLTPTLGTTLRESLANEDSLTLLARVITQVRIKIGHYKSHTSKVRVKCRIQISNPSRGNVRLLNNSCKFKLLRLRL
ncbi:hypothetical protein L7F22_046966 [Adiantum nelumboides]|nr:hypothetical protein [Adiantum nelumboides]